MITATKQRTTVFIDIEILEHIKLNPDIRNLSVWINTRYPNEFMAVEMETNKLKKLEEDKELCIKRIKYVKTLDTGIELPKLALEWLKYEGKKRAKNYSTEGVLRYFNDKFRLNLSIRQFRILLDNVVSADTTAKMR